MQPMPMQLGWGELGLRLLLTLLAGALFGLDRGRRDRPAGLRTTMLVCLAASVAMMQANLLLPQAGKAADSFVTMDLMRLPLGILSGVGFIGAGAILRRDTLVVGVTTAATLWFVTVVGLCLGGGQIGLGLTALAAGLLVVWVLRWAEHFLWQTHRSELVLALADGAPEPAALRARLAAAGLEIAAEAVRFAAGGARCERRYVLRHRCRRDAPVEPPPMLDALAREPWVRQLRWTP